MTSTTKIILAIMTDWLAVLVWCAVAADGQDVNPIDTSGIGLPTDEPITGTLYIYQPWIIWPDTYTKVWVSVDLKTWQMADELPTAYCVAIPVISSNQATFFRISNQTGQ